MSEKKRLSLTKEEQETIILFDNSCNEAQVYTCSSSIMTRLDKLCKSHPDNYKLTKQDTQSKTYLLADKRLISFRAERSKRELTDEQKKAFAERMKNASG